LEDCSVFGNFVITLIYIIDLVNIDTTYRWFTCNYDIFYTNEICFKLFLQILF